MDSFRFQPCLTKCWSHVHGRQRILGVPKWIRGGEPDSDVPSSGSLRNRIRELLHKWWCLSVFGRRQTRGDRGPQQLCHSAVQLHLWPSP